MQHQTSPTSKLPATQTLAKKSLPLLLTKWLLMLASVVSMAAGCQSEEPHQEKNEEETQKAGSRVIKTIDKTTAKNLSPTKTLAIHTPGLPKAKGVDDSALRKMPHLKVILESLYRVQKRYVDPARLDAKRMFVHGLKEVQENTAAVQIRLFPEDSKDPDLAVVQVGKSLLPFSLAQLKNSNDTYNYFRWILGFIKQELKETGDFDKEEQAKLEYSAINGFLDFLDPYSVLLPPKSFGEMKIRTSGSFGGIGIVISIRKGALTVISPIDGTPAARAGIQPSDKIVRIGPESTVNMNLHEAVSRLRGKVGTKVTFWIERDGLPAPKKVTLTRARIEIHSVDSRNMKGSVGYLRVSRFSENTLPELKKHIYKLEKGGAKSLILDLTKNPGGLLSQAVAVADAFVDRGTIVTTEGAGRVRIDTKTAKKSSTLWRKPMVVLVDRGSASAAEIVAGALKHLGRAVVFGERTFGKGTVQVLKRNSDNSALKLTVARYLVRGDVPIQTVGIVPDLMTLPITIRKKWVRFHTLQQKSGEQQLPEHLSPGRDVKIPKPHWSLKYLKENKKKKKVSADADSGADQRLVGLARDFLVKHRGTRDEMMKEAKTFVIKQREGLEKKIVGAVKKLGVNWSAGPKGDTAPKGSKLKVSLSCDKPKNTVAAEQKLTVTMTVKNTGDSAVHRVRGLLKAPAYYLDDREFLFGRLSAGQKRSWKVEMKIPGHQRNQVQPLWAKLFRDDTPVKQTTGVTKDTPFFLAIKALKRPAMKIVYTLEEKKGNGNGKLEAGETAAIKGTLHNIGEGVAKKAVVTVRNASGKWVYLIKGRALKEGLQPGKSQPFELSLRLQKEGVKNKLELELGAFESTVRVGFDKKVALDLQKPVSSLGGALQAPFIDLNLPEPLTQSASVKISGKVTHPKHIRDLYVFISNEKNLSYRKKVHYKASAKPHTKEMAFDKVVKLPKGLNTIVILARHSKHLTTYRLFKVLRRKVQETRPTGAGQGEDATPKAGEAAARKRPQASPQAR